VSPDAAATAVDAGATAWHAVTRRAAVGPGDAVVIVGVGGLGGYAVQIARNAGASPVIAADVDADRLAEARRFGADEAILVEEGKSLGREVKLLTDGGVDKALEFVGRASTIDAAIKCLRPGGVAVAVGVGTEPLVTLPPVLWSNHEYTLTGSYGSLPGDAEAVLAALANGSLQPPAIGEVALEDAAAVITAAARGEGTGAGRLMVVP
jgi:threonine dehydrogenase-like Zn-dependent dehydrogenase